MRIASEQRLKSVDDFSVTSALTRRRILAHALLAAAVVLCAALFLYPPSRVSLYPACPIYQILHLECPGCGSTRALAALLHGHLHEALRLNALFVLLLPFALLGAAVSYRRALRPGVFCWPRPPAAALYATLAVTVLFTIARNLSQRAF
jgi:preprotein translocase subunit Sec61beta